MPEDDYTIAPVPRLELADVASPAELFPGKKGEREFGGEVGIGKAAPFTAEELARIGVLIKQQFVRSAAAQSQALADAFEATPLERLHEVSVLVPYDHGRLLSKLNRILPPEATAEIKTMSPFAYLREVFGDFYLCDEDDVGFEEISFRLVRPGRREDVGQLHADDWFWQINQHKCPPGANRVKLWTSVCGDPETAGLRLAPRSHLLEATCRSGKQDGRVFFESDVDWHDIDLRRYVAKPGAPILFNHRTLHVGSMNPGPESRVSFETTIMFHQ